MHLPGGSASASDSRLYQPLARTFSASVFSPTDCGTTIVVCSVFVTLAWIALILRIWTKATIVRFVGADDYLILAATIFFTVYGASIINISTRVTSQHQIVSWNDLLVSVQLLTVAEVFYILSLLFLKISLGLLFLRIAIEPWHRTLIYSTVAVSTLFSIAIFWFALFQCGYYSNPTDYIWKRLTDACASNSATLGMVYTHAAITTLTDWTFLLFPLIILRNSLMKPVDKLTVAALLMFASVSGIASIIRFKFINGLAVPKENFFANGRDIAVWSAIEPGVGIAAGCLVTLRPLFRSLFSPTSESPLPVNLDGFSQMLEEIETHPHRKIAAADNHADIEKRYEESPPILVEQPRTALKPKSVSKNRSSGLPLAFFGSDNDSLGSRWSRLSRGSL